MSLRATAWAWKVPVPAHIQPTLLALADYHNDKTGQCNPRMAVLAARVRRSVRVVRGHVAWLEARGLLARSDHHLPGLADQSNFYALAIEYPPATSDRGAPATSDREPRLPVAALEPAVEPAVQNHMTSSCADLSVCAPRTDIKETSKTVEYYDVWGSPQERESERQAQSIRQQREATARAKKTVLAARPRSQWGPGQLADFFRSQVMLLGLQRLPHHLDKRSMSGAFAELLKKGFRPDELASAVEAFCVDRSIWTEAVEVKGAPIWKVFIKRAPDLATRSAASSPAALHKAETERLPGYEW